MSSAETTHPIEWRDDGKGREAAYHNDVRIGWIRFTSQGTLRALVGGAGSGPCWSSYFPSDLRPLARSFVEKSVKEAGHGE